MTTTDKLCPICEEGYLTMKSRFIVVKQGEYSANVQLNYAQCSVCSCEILVEGQDIENIFNMEQFYYDAMDRGDLITSLDYKPKN